MSCNAANTNSPAAKKSGGLSSMLQSFAGKAQSQLSNFSVNELPHQLRQAQVAYDPRQSIHTLKLQLVIKSAKGVIVDTEAVARETHSLSKQVYLWAKEQDGEDLQDVGDRLAFLTYKSGDLQMKYAEALERARVDLKDIRNFENDLGKIRDRRKALETQLAKARADPKPKADHRERLTALTTELATITQESGTYEAALEVLKRRKVCSSFQTQFAAMRELGEQLALLAGYGDLLLQELNSGRTDENEIPKYKGKDRTAWIRGAAAESLAKYEGPLVEAPLMGGKAVGTGGTGAEISRSNSDMRSFGESHRCELANLPSPSTSGLASTISATSTASHPQTSPFADTHGVPLSSTQGALNHSPVFLATLPTRTVQSQTASTELSAAAAPGTSLAVAATETLPPPPAGPDPTVAEIGGTVPTGTGGPAMGQFPIRPSKPMTKAEEAAREADEGRATEQAEMSTSRRLMDAGVEDLPAYSFEASDGQQAPAQLPPPEKS